MALKKENIIERKTTKVLVHIIQMTQFFETYLLNYDEGKIRIPF